ncbi:peptidase-S9 domain-containing protein [Favolaschia claudopus]|uniref:acylaminoacyl-peptidase n=1 Tax=Favolaschia claudopus TaxID=2862362 RepID=A0AAW0AXG6_9AGAR
MPSGWYRVLSEIPVPTAAHFVGNVVQLESSINDNERDIKRSVTTSLFVGSPQVSVGPAVEMGDIVASAEAPSTSICFPRRVVLRETSAHKRYVEIWIGNVIEGSKDVTELHDSFYTDEFFSGFSFSTTELAFSYVAEAKPPTDPQDKFKFTPSFGEHLRDKRRPTIFILRWNPSSIPCEVSLSSVSLALPSGFAVSLGQPVFCPLNSDTIYATGYEDTPDGRRLGLKWCPNRPSGIWAIKLPATPDNPEGDSVTPLVCSARKLTPSNLSCRSPRIYFDAEQNAAKLFWLSCVSGGPHAGTLSLHVLNNLTSREAKSRVLVDTVWEPRESDGFPGLYPSNANNLPVAPFVKLGDSVFLVFSSTWGVRNTVLLISTVDGSIKDLTPNSEGALYSWNMLATDGTKRFVCSRSALDIPHEVVLCEFDSPETISSRVIYAPYISTALRTALEKLSTVLVAIPDRRKVQTLVVRPAPTNATPPAIHFVHGGPHAVMTTSFSPAVALLALEGYTMSLVNYTGSVGYGENFVRGLIGKCGTLDVQDCIASVRHLNKIGISAEGKGKQFVIGGSHGGFLASHLIGQFPDIFTAAVILNPVISTDPMSSDIRDWYFNEWDIEFPMYSLPEGFPETSTQAQASIEPRLPPRSLPASESLRLSASMAWVDQVRAHVLLHIGGSDVRVTPTHGLEYYHALKGLNVVNLKERREQDVEMHWFEKAGHSLDDVETSRVVWETARGWVNKYRV